MSDGNAVSRRAFLALGGAAGAAGVAWTVVGAPGTASARPAGSAAATGYGRDGLVEEAITLADLRYTGVGTWLPWCTVAQLEPLARLDDIFGSMDIATIEQLPLATRQTLNTAAGTTL
jgi:hypothetical protein